MFLSLKWFCICFRLGLHRKRRHHARIARPWSSGRRKRRSHAKRKNARNARRERREKIKRKLTSFSKEDRKKSPILRISLSRLKQFAILNPMFLCLWTGASILWKTRVCHAICVLLNSIPIRHSYLLSFSKWRIWNSQVMRIKRKLHRLVLSP